MGSGSLISLAGPRHGHFDLGTGNHGDLWLDLDGLFLHPATLQPHVRELADLLRAHVVDAVCSPAEGGAFLAQALATVLGVAFLPAYRALPHREGALAGYRLPWLPGGIAGWKVAVADDAVNAGTAVRACFRLLEDRAASPDSFHIHQDLDLNAFDHGDGAAGGTHITTIPRCLVPRHGTQQATDQLDGSRIVSKEINVPRFDF